MKGFPSNGKLTATQTRRIRRLMPVYAGRIWHESSHWLNLEWDWAPVGDLTYALTMQSLVSWSHLFPSVKSATADFRLLSSETCHNHPFSGLPRLADVIDKRFRGQAGLPTPQVKEWMVALGKGLRRIVLDGAEQTERVREADLRLERSQWQISGGMESVPYVEGKPAGTPRPIDVYWQNDLLCVQYSSSAKMAKSVPQELGRAFDKQEISDAIKLCYDRPAEFIDDYLEDNFNLAPPKGRGRTGMLE